MRIALVLVLALLACGCTGGSNAPAAGLIPQLAAYLLAANSTVNNGVVVFRVNGDGSLDLVSSVATSDGLISLESHPTRPFVYAGGFSPDLLGFQIDAAGQLTALPGFPVPSEPENNVVLDRSGRFLYSLGENAIDGFAVDQATGNLARLPAFPLTGLGELFNGKFDQNNDFLYVADRGADAVVTFSLNDLTGELTEVARVNLLDPTAIEVAPAGFLYVAEEGGNLNGYIREADGSLTQIAGLPVNYAPPGALTARFDFQGNTLFIGDRTSATINAFTIGNGGGLTGVPGYPQAGGGGDLLVYPLTSFLFDSDRPAVVINGFSIGAGAVLTPNPGSPYPSIGGSNELLPVMPRS